MIDLKFETRETRVKASPSQNLRPRRTGSRSLARRAHIGAIDAFRGKIIPDSRTDVYERDS